MIKTEFLLRKVVSSDMQLLFDWVNDDEVRQNAITTNKISFEEHKTWFKKKLNSSKCEFFILEKAIEPVAQIRFDYNGFKKVWEIDYSVAEEFRGIGLSKILLTEAMNSFNKYPLVGYVREDNMRSNNVFTSLGFLNDGMEKIKNIALIKYIKNAGP